MLRDRSRYVLSNFQRRRMVLVQGCRALTRRRLGAMQAPGDSWEGAPGRLSGSKGGAITGRMCLQRARFVWLKRICRTWLITASMSCRWPCRVLKVRFAAVWNK